MTEDNPWKTCGSRLVYENPWIRLREDKVIRPDGKEGIYSVIDTRVATGVVALTEANEVYLVGQYRYPIDEYSWEIVEGGTDESETPLDAAMRELREETGLIASHWRELGAEVHLSNCFSSESARFFLARGLTQVEANPDPTEILKIRKVPFQEALSMVNTGAIKDAVSIIGIVRAERFLSHDSFE